eukprot:133901-Chlamydomonas_euryale.AAC.7
MAAPVHRSGRCPGGWSHASLRSSSSAAVSVNSTSESGPRKRGRAAAAPAATRAESTGMLSGARRWAGAPCRALPNLLDCIHLLRGAFDGLCHRIRNVPDPKTPRACMHAGGWSVGEGPLGIVCCARHLCIPSLHPGSSAAVLRGEAPPRPDGRHARAPTWAALCACAQLLEDGRRRVLLGAADHVALWEQRGAG